MPRNNAPKIAAIHTKVCAALRLRGSWKAVMPLEMASTPVKAVVPLAEGMEEQEGGDGLRRVRHVQGGGIRHGPQGAHEDAQESRPHRQAHHPRKT